MTSKKKRKSSIPPQVQVSKISTKEEECSKQKGESSKDDEKGKIQTSKSSIEVKKYKRKGQQRGSNSKSVINGESKN